MGKGGRPSFRLTPVVSIAEIGSKGEACRNPGEGMSDTSSVAQAETVEAGLADYARFIILTRARTGSNMLASALNSSPDIICFRDVFNPDAEGVPYFVAGYGILSVEDLALRNEDFERFLRERIFCTHPEEVRAVGFKMPHVHFPSFPGLLEWLVEERDLRVLHLQRRNLLRMLVSNKIAGSTGGWFEQRRPTLVTRLKRSNAAWAARHPLSVTRHPLRATRKLWRIMFPKEQAPAWKALRRPVTLTKQECLDFFSEVERDSAHYGGLFGDHAQLTLYYEDLVQEHKHLFGEVQSFLGLKPKSLAPTTRRQNPEPLRELIANYDELYAAFRDRPERAFFD